MTRGSTALAPCSHSMPSRRTSRSTWKHLEHTELTRCYKIRQMLRGHNCGHQQEGRSGRGEDCQPPAVATCHHSVAESTAPRKMPNRSTALWRQRVTTLGGSFFQKENLSVAASKQFMLKKTFSWNFWGRGSSIKSTLKGVLFWNISYQTTPSDFWAALLRRSKVSILHSHPLSRCTVLHLLACRAPNKGAKKKSTFLKTTVQSRIWLQIQPGTAHWLCSTSKDCFDTEPQDFIQLSPGLLLTAAGKQHKVLCTFWDL